jgi:hypothetical protein
VNLLRDGLVNLLRDGLVNLLRDGRDDEVRYGCDQRSSMIINEGCGMDATMKYGMSVINAVP